MNITGGIIPNDQEIKSWYDIMEKDPLKEVYEIEDNTWGFKYLFTEEDLFQKINDYGSIEKFAEDMGMDHESIFKWLNELYKFLKENKFNDCFFNYNMIPNQNGNFKKIDEIFGNNDRKKIPDIIHPIYKTIFNQDLNDIILNERIDLKLFGNNIKQKNFQKIFNEFSDFFKKRDDKESDNDDYNYDVDNDNNNINKDIIEYKKEYLCNQFLSFNVDRQKIQQMFLFRSQTNTEYKNKEKYVLDFYNKRHNLWREVEDYWFNYHSNIIESKKNIENLKQILLDQKEKKDPLAWLNRYIDFLQKFSTILGGKKIFPNQNGNFKLLEKLQYEDDVPELFKDILNILKRVENKDYDIRDLLMSKEIKAYKSHNKFTQKDAVSQIENLFKDEELKKNNSEIRTIIAEKIITFCPIAEKNIYSKKKYITIGKALHQIVEYYNQILNKNLKINETYITTELNYGIFVKYILKLIFNKIEKMESSEIKNNIEIIPKIISYAWYYELNRDINLLVNPKKYKIFANQDNQLVNIDEIHFKDWYNNKKYINIEEELFNLSKNPIINFNFKKKILAQSFYGHLEVYKNNFKILKLDSTCQQYIDSIIIKYFHEKVKYNLKTDHNFISAFRALNQIIKNNPELKEYFPQFCRERGNIALNFSEENEKDNFIEEVIKNIMRKNRSFNYT